MNGIAEHSQKKKNLKKLHAQITKHSSFTNSFIELNKG